MSNDTRCTKCGGFLGSWLTESGDFLVVQPCENGCTPSMPDKFETDEDFEEDE